MQMIFGRITSCSGGSAFFLGPASACRPRVYGYTESATVTRNGSLYDGFAIDYGCYVALMLDSKLPSRPRQRVGWLNSTHAVPPDGFDFRAEAIDVAIQQGAAVG